jgi:hypothetical protein
VIVLSHFYLVLEQLNGCPAAVASIRFANWGGGSDLGTAQHPPELTPMPGSLSGVCHHIVLPLY